MPSKRDVLDQLKWDELAGPKARPRNTGRLAATLREQQAEATKLDAAIAANLKELRYGG